MDEERYNLLYNRILDGENWDYSTLDELLAIAESNGKDMGLKEASLKMAKNIKYEDIINIRSIICSFNSMLEVKIKGLKKKGFSDIAKVYEKDIEDIEKGVKSLHKIRAALHLADDFGYNQVFKQVKS